MGASPKHQLSLLAAECLTWLNTPPHQIVAWKSEIWMLHCKLWILLAALQVMRVRDLLGRVAADRDTLSKQTRLRTVRRQYLFLSRAYKKCFAALKARLAEITDGERNPAVDRVFRTLRQSSPQQYLDLLFEAIEHLLPPLPHKLVRTPAPLVLPAWERLDEVGQALYRFAALLQDLWQKGYHRLKICQWPGCGRWLWDPTNAFNKVFCELHDKERAKARAKKQAEERARPSVKRSR